MRKGKVDDMYGYQEITCHVIFDTKMDFTWKAIYVDNVSKTEAQVALTQSTVVSWDSVRLEFLISALNDLDVMECNIGNKYLNVPCKENIWFQAGSECGEHRVKIMILVRSLYVLNNSGASWRSMFKEIIEKNLHFKSTQIDSNVYIKRNRR